MLLAKADLTGLVRHNPIHSVPVTPNHITISDPPARPARSAFTLLLDLDALSGKGISEQEFNNLLTSCSLCRRVITTEMFNKHECETLRAIHTAGEGDTIDLSGIASDDD